MAGRCAGVSGTQLLQSFLVSHFFSSFRFEKLVSLESQLGVNVLLLLLQGNHAVSFLNFALPSDLGFCDLPAGGFQRVGVDGE